MSETSTPTDVEEKPLKVPRSDEKSSENADLSAEQAEGSGDAPNWTAYTNVPFRLLGYGILMGWHFLLIYFLTTPENIHSDPRILFNRQVALNASLVAAFVVVLTLSKRKVFDLQRFPNALIWGAAGIGAISTVGMMAAAIFDCQAAVLSLTAAAGAAEAILLLAWLHFYSESSSNYATRYIAFSLVIGAIAAYLIRHLTLEVALVCFASLPVLSAAMLISSACQTPVRVGERGERGVRDHHGALKPLGTATIHLVVYSFVFGFLQGSLLPDGQGMLGAFTPNTVIGAGVAGVACMLIFHKVPGKLAPETLRMLAMFTFTMGLLLTAFPMPYMKAIAGMVVMAGFIIVDISSLTFVVRLIRAYDLSVAFAVGLNRAAEYAAFAVSIMLGSVCASLFGGSDICPIAVSSFSVAVILGYTLLSMGCKNLDWIDQLYPKISEKIAEAQLRAEDPIDPALEADKAKAESERESSPIYGRFRTRCRIVCERSGLSPRETEVFMLMAKGRNAEYIQGALTISNYTAKTHISNIYRKVGVHSLQELIDAVEAVDDGEVKDQQAIELGK